jgi:predicted CXXCH cytochrome family protein
MTKYSINIACIILGWIIVSLLTPDSIFSESIRNGPHGDRSKVLKGCYSCHKGHGVLNTPMLPNSKSIFCYRCHGNNLFVEETRHKGDLANNTKSVNVQDVFQKTYRHPAEKSGSSRYDDETIPEKDPSAERHAGCVDCHHHHYVSEYNLFAGLKGVTANGEAIDKIGFEYELCFKCHSYSANLPFDQTNKALIFNLKNPSYHPVLGPGTNNDVPSLTGAFTTSSVIKCTDCHGNDDPIGPKGVHGSNYNHILKKNFNEADGIEGTLQYELCYNCHSRDSILNNISFQYHNLHILKVGVSCRTCHNPHGSQKYSHLIDFDNLSISTSSSGKIEFRGLGHRTGECYLTCHRKDHNPAGYPSGPTSPSSIKASGSENRR